MYRKQVRRRRAILVLLIVAALVLLSTARSPSADGGPLHSMQRGVASVFGPLEEGASRALKPARDLVNWFDETFQARGENSELHAEVAAAPQRGRQGAGRRGREPPAPQAPRARPRRHARRLHAGHRAGDRPLAHGLVLDRDDRQGLRATACGSTTRWSTATGWSGGSRDVTHGTAEVTLITDNRSAVSAQACCRTGPRAWPSRRSGNSSNLLLDFIDKSQAIRQGEIVVTAGWSNGAISSAFPPGIPIGQVSDATRRRAGDLPARPPASRSPTSRNLDYVQVAHRRAQAAGGDRSDRHPPQSRSGSRSDRPRRSCSSSRSSRT